MKMRMLLGCVLAAIAALFLATTRKDRFTVPPDLRDAVSDGDICAKIARTAKRKFSRLMARRILGL